MRNLYSVDFEQHDREGVPYNSGRQEVLARSAEEAIRKGRQRERELGYLKSRPLECVALKIIAADVS